VYVLRVSRYARATVQDRGARSRESSRRCTFTLTAPFKPAPVWSSSRKGAGGSTRVIREHVQLYVDRMEMESSVFRSQEAFGRASPCRGDNLTDLHISSHSLLLINELHYM
jgi:hypothetical protein